MRVLQSPLLALVPAYICFLTFPNAVLSGSVLRTGLQARAEANRAVLKLPSGTVTNTPKRDSWTSFLNTSHVIGSIKGALFPPGPDVTASVQPEALAAPSNGETLPDFWNSLEKYEHIAQDYVPQLLNSAAVFFDSTKFTDVMSAMHGIVNTTATFHDSIQGNLRARGITLDTLTLELEGVFIAIAEDLRNTPPPDEAPGHAERAKMVDTILDKVAMGLENISPRLGIEEEAATNYVRAVKPHVQALVVAVGDINEQHPHLFPAIAFSVVVLLIPQRWILELLLGLFGFGPAGIVRGSAAAWLQSYFWGATVESGSWFAWLQAAGMGVIPKWADIIAKVPVLVGGLMAMLFPAKQNQP